MAEPFVVTERTGDVVTLWMNRPQRRNALSHDMMRALLDAFRAAGDLEARAVVLAGHGPVFSAGHDFADLVDADEDGVRAMLTTCLDLMRCMQSLPQPVIARVHGLATAAGCQLVAAADLAVAAQSAGFAAPGGKGGWFCHTPMVPIARVISRKRAVELAFSGDVIDAATACHWGLINAVVPDEDLDAAVQTMVERVTRGSARSKALGKRTLYAQLDLDDDQAWELALDVMAKSSQDADAREGMRAFLEKRQPRWSDK
jgi:enoyl-CoA hydratase/carnithine racemase